MRQFSQTISSMFPCRDSSNRAHASPCRNVTADCQAGRFHRRQRRSTAPMVAATDFSSRIHSRVSWKSGEIAQTCQPPLPDVSRITAKPGAFNSTRKAAKASSRARSACAVGARQSPCRPSAIAAGRLLSRGQTPSRILANRRCLTKPKKLPAPQSQLLTANVFLAAVLVPKAHDEMHCAVAIVKMLAKRSPFALRLNGVGAFRLPTQNGERIRACPI